MYQGSGFILPPIPSLGISVVLGDHAWNVIIRDTSGAVGWVHRSRRVLSFPYHTALGDGRMVRENIVKATLMDIIPLSALDRCPTPACYRLARGLENGGKRSGC